MRVKRITAVFLAIIFMSSGITIAGAYNGVQNLMSGFSKTKTYDNNFSDTQGHWAEVYIANAYEYGIIEGIGGDLYNPDGSLTIAQTITIAARLHMKYIGAVGQVAGNPASGHWAAPYVNYATGKGLLVDEWGDALDRPATRAETIRIFSRILKPDDMASRNTVYSLPDVSPSTPYSAEITTFYEAGIVQGSTANNSFNPDGIFTRAEAAALITRVMEADKRINGKTYGIMAISVFAGTGTSGFSNRTAAASSFTLPYGLTVDNNGRIVIFDTYNNALRLITNSQVGTIAGRWIETDDSGFSKGDLKNGSLSQSLFNRPTGGVYNADGDLFVCDSENHVIRLIRNGNSYTFAGSSAGHKDGMGGTAKFNTPMAIAADKSGNLYVADTLNNCIRKIDGNGSVTTVAGKPDKIGFSDGEASSALFYAPSGIAVNDDGSKIYVADTGNHKIRVIENGKVTTLSGVTTEKDSDGDPLGGYRDGTNAMFNLPKGIALAGDTLFVADSGNNVIRAVNMKGQAFTAAGTGEPGDREGGTLTAEFDQPSGVLWHDGILYIADTTNNVIKTLTVDLAVFKGAE